MHIIVLHLDYVRPSVGQTDWRDGSQFLAVDPGQSAAGHLGLCVWRRTGRRCLPPVLPEWDSRPRGARRGLLPDLAAPGLAADLAAHRLPERTFRRAD